jgi:hypothetical protein
VCVCVSIYLHIYLSIDRSISHKAPCCLPAEMGQVICTRLYLSIDLSIGTYTYIHMYIHAYINTYIHIYIYAYTHIYIYTYIHIYIFMLCIYASISIHDLVDGARGGRMTHIGRQVQFRNLMCVCVCMCARACVSVCVTSQKYYTYASHVYIYVCIYVCMLACMYRYIHTVVFPWRHLIR